MPSCAVQLCAQHWQEAFSRTRAALAWAAACRAAKRRSPATSRDRGGMVQPLVEQETVAVRSACPVSRTVQVRPGVRPVGSSVGVVLTRGHPFRRSGGRRGLAHDSRALLAFGDGTLGFWSALAEVFPATRHQRCRGLEPCPTEPGVAGESHPAEPSTFREGERSAAVVDVGAGRQGGQVGRAVGLVQVSQARGVSGNVDAGTAHRIGRGVSAVTTVRPVRRVGTRVRHVPRTFQCSRVVAASGLIARTAISGAPLKEISSY